MCPRPAIYLYRGVLTCCMWSKSSQRAADNTRQRAFTQLAERRGSVFSRTSQNGSVRPCFLCMEYLAFSELSKGAEDNTPASACFHSTRRKAICSQLTERQYADYRFCDLRKGAADNTRHACSRGPRTDGIMQSRTDGLVHEQRGSCPSPSVCALLRFVSEGTSRHAACSGHDSDGRVHEPARDLTPSFKSVMSFILFKDPSSSGIPPPRSSGIPPPPPPPPPSAGAPTPPPTPLGAAACGSCARPSP